MLFALLACFSDKPTAKVETPAAPPPAVVEAKRPVLPFNCCDSAEATAIVSAYAALNAVLAADGDPQPALDAVVAASLGPIPGESAKLAALKGKSVDEVREGLKAVSGPLVAFARAHPGGATPLREAFCPMANAGWIQAGETIANPYYGAKMLTCGSFR